MISESKVAPCQGYDEFKVNELKKGYFVTGRLGKVVKPEEKFSSLALNRADVETVTTHPVYSGLLHEIS